MTQTPKFYIVKRPAGNCEILPLAEPSQRIAQLEEQNPTIIEKWGPYDSPEDAIARRIGLIRAGKCQPQWRIAIAFLRIAKANVTCNEGLPEIAKHSSLKSGLLAVLLPPNAFF